VWLYDNTEFRIEAFIIGFDEFMNVVLDEAEEVYDCGAKPGKEVKPRRSLGGCCVWSVGGRWRGRWTRGAGPPDDG
jgi:small nuclear ribonucleoprotein (snRNP)-like protein